MSMGPFLALVRKDLQLFFGDRRALILSIVVPIVLASFMAFIFGGIGEGAAGKIAVQVADHDDSPLSREIITAMRSDKTLDTQTAGADEVRAAVRRGKAVVGVIFPTEFGKSASSSLFGGPDRPVLTLVTDPSHTAESAMVRGMLMQHVMEKVTRSAFSSVASSESIRKSLAQVESDTSIAEGDRAALKTMFDGLLGWFDRLDTARSNNEDVPSRGFRMPFDTRDETIAITKQQELIANYAHSFAGMVVQFVLFGSIEIGLGILLERQRGLWRRLRTAPLSKLTLLGSRAVSGTIIGLISILVVFGFGMATFGIRIQGSALGFVLIAITYALAASCLGLLIAALGKTPQAARGVSVLFILIMVMLGGAWMPTFLFPPWLQQLTPAFPTRWGVDGFEAMTWRGLGFTDALTCSAALLGFAVFLGGLAVWRFRWEES
jgi:ABC-2 type transport system permease protein